MAPGAPERFRFRADALRAAESRTRRQLAVRLAATAAIVAGAWAVALRPRGSGPGTLVFSLALLAALAGATFARRMRHLHVRWASFHIALEGEAVARHVDGFPPVRIARADAVSLDEGAQGILIRDRGGQAILVPREVDGYERLRAALAAWAPRGG